MSNPMMRLAVVMVGVSSFGVATGVIQNACCENVANIVSVGSNGPYTGSSAMSCEAAPNSVPRDGLSFSQTARNAVCTLYQQNGGSVVQGPCNQPPPAGYVKIPGTIQPGGTCCYVKSTNTSTTEIKMELMITPCGTSFCKCDGPECP